HPALGRASRKGMHRSSLQAHLMEVNHTHLAVDLGESEVAGSSWEFVPTTEKPPYPARNMPPQSRVRPAGVGKPEVLGPSHHEAVQPGSQLWPGRRVAPV